MKKEKGKEWNWVLGSIVTISLVLVGYILSTGSQDDNIVPTNKTDSGTIMGYIIDGIGFGSLVLLLMLAMVISFYYFHRNTFNYKKRKFKPNVDLFDKTNFGGHIYAFFFFLFCFFLYILRK